MLRTIYRGTLLGAAVLVAGCGDPGSLIDPGDRDADVVSLPTFYAAPTVKEKHNATIVSATGNITAAVDQYRTLLGTLNPNVAGEQPGGRREINWDGVPAMFTNNDLFPGNFFNATSPRGVLFTTPGSAFRVSSNGYVDVNANYAGEFNTFSPIRLFATRGSTITEVRFVVAGSNTPATVTGFGSVFADVGQAHSTTIEYFDSLGTKLLTVVAPRASDATGLSFVGAVFDARVVAKVRITSGDTPINPGVNDNVKGAGPKRDIVVMDDFIYGEPIRAIPEPGIWALMLAGFGALGWMARRRRS